LWAQSATPGARHLEALEQENWADRREA